MTEGSRKALNISKRKEACVLQTLHSENFRSLGPPAKAVPNAVKSVASSNHKSGNPEFARPSQAWAGVRREQKRGACLWYYALQTLSWLQNQSVRKTLCLSTFPACVCLLVWQKLLLACWEGAIPMSSNRLCKSEWQCYKYIVFIPNGNIMCKLFCNFFFSQLSWSSFLSQ